MSRVTLSFPFATSPGRSALGLVWPLESILLYCARLNDPEGSTDGHESPNAVLSGFLDMPIEIVPGTAKLLWGREPEGWLDIEFLADVPDGLMEQAIMDRIAMAGLTG